mmetsp:Transcript_104728/g.312832  ORF Transcript_104728/g.312832 Transcript_104728/m.312832 type:complete len:290 (+) Transcript_104728:68-937(+)
MVLLELATLGNGVALTGLVKAAAAGSAGTAAALLAPSHSVLESLKVAVAGHAGTAAALAAPPHAVLESLKVLPAHSAESLLHVGDSLSRLASSATAAVALLTTEAGRTGLGVATTSAALGGFLHVRGGLRLQRGAGGESSEEKERDDPEDSRAIPRVLSVSVPLCVVLDACMAGIVVHSLGQPLSVPLRTWVLGGLLLSFPTSWVIRTVAKQHGIRCGFLLESVAVFTAFTWLSWGTMLLSNFPEGMHTAPLLYWSSFGQCVLMWSITTVAVSMMIIVTVLSLLPAAQS